jgi:alpha-glucan,water dikinase
MQVLGFPSKRIGLFCPDTLIFRSDSNGEDLEGYAGAGLYDRWALAKSFLDSS